MKTRVTRLIAALGAVTALALARAITPASAKRATAPATVGSLPDGSCGRSTVLPIPIGHGPDSKITREPE